MSQARLFVFVHDLSGQPVDAKVQYARSAKQRWRTLKYDPRLQRHIGAKLRLGPCLLRIQGPKGTSKEHRELILEEGDNRASVMVAVPGLPALHTPEGNWYFETRPGTRLLHVSGPGAQEQAVKQLRRHKLKSKSLPLASDREDDALLLVTVGEGEGDKRLSTLQRIASQSLPEQGLQARITVPAYVEGEVAFGLTGDVVIRFQSAATRAEIAALAESYGLEELRHIAWMGNAYLFRAPGDSAAKLLDLVDDLNRNSLVVYAELDLANRLQSFAYTPGDYLYPATPHLGLVNADDAWDNIQTNTTVNRGGSPSVVVAVLDPHGVDPSHAELTDNLSDGSAKQIANFDFVNMANQTFANLGGDHGTQCAGSATGRFDNVVGSCGIAPNCKLIGGAFSGFASNLQIADMWVWMAGFPTGSTQVGFPAQLAQGADIISNSWGPQFAAPSQTLRDAFDFLTTYPRKGRGVIMCFAAGNYGYSVVDNRNPFAADAKTLNVGSSINSNPTNPVNSTQADQNGTMNNLPAVVDRRSYFSPYGNTMDLVSPSHTCYGPGLPGAGIVDPIMAPARTGQGDWPASATSSTTLTAAVAAGSTAMPVASTAGFAVGSVVLLRAPGALNAEVTSVTSLGAGQLNVAAIANAHPVGTSVATGAADYAKNAAIGFGGTSHSCPTVAGTAALLLSVRPDLTWVEVRQILRSTAVQIDIGQTFATGQWVDLDGDGVVEYSQWYGYGRLDVNAAVTAAIALSNRADSVVRDNLGDTGTVPTPGWHAASPDIWVRQADDAIPALAYTAAPPHQNPRFGQDNYVFMRVRNRGNAVAPVIYLRAIITHYAGVDFVYPNDWQPAPRFGVVPTLPLQPASYLIGEVAVNNLAAGANKIVKITWDQDLVPPETVTVSGSQVKWHPCLLVEAAPHDGPAVVTGTFNTVMGDNNIAQRNIAIDYPSVGGSAGLMTAVAAGTRLPVGVDSVIVDRSAVRADVGVVIRTSDSAVMDRWIEIVRSGKGLVAAEPLGTLRPHKPAPEGDLVEDLPEDSCAVTLLDPARLAIRCCDGNVMVVDAPKATRISVLCRGGAAAVLRDRVSLATWQGQTVLRLDHGVGAVALPLRLAAGQFTPVLVGTDKPNATSQLTGRILISQLRGDGQVSPGYEIEI